LWMVAVLAAGWAYSFASDAGTKRNHLQVTKLRSVATKDWPTGIAWSPDGKKIAAIHDFGRVISVWSSGGEPIASIKRDVTTGPYVGSSLAFMPDNRTILAPAPTPSHEEYSSLGLWDTETGALQRLVPPPSSGRIFQAVVARIFALSPDYSLVAVRPIDSQEPISIYRTADWSLIKTKQVWRSETVGLKPFLRSDVPGVTPAYEVMPHDFGETVNALAFAPNNDLAIGLISGLVMMGSDPSSTFFQFIESASTPVAGLAYSPNGKFIAVGTRNPSSSPPPKAHPAFLQIRDVESGNILVEDNTIPAVQNLAWDRDGQILAVITESDTMYLYRPFMDGSVHQSVPVSRGTSTLSFSPTKSELAVSTPNGVDFYSIK
ncbi:MAG: WD40 repeat domain-containing protein, partial [Afipia sp.]